MNKTKFLEYCRTALPHIELRVVVETESREIYPTVRLCGAWGRDEDNIYSSSVALFKPQWRKDDFRTWKDTCEARAIKFRRWLDEFKQLKSDA